MIKYFSYDPSSARCLCHECHHSWTADSTLQKCMEHNQEDIVTCPNCNQLALMKTDKDAWQAALEDEMEALLDDFLR